MAYTYTAAATTVFGNQRVSQGVLTADATSGVVSFGLATITHMTWSAKSMTTNNSGTLTRFRINATAGGVAAAGTLGVSGLVSGDEVYLTVYGR